MRYRVNHPQVINEMIDGEAIMINLASGSYYSLDTLGAEIWGLVEKSLSADDIVVELRRRYDAPASEIDSAVRDLLEQMSREQLIVPDEGARPGAPTPAGSPETDRMPFRAPQLQKFTDMQDLILLDPVHEVAQQGWPHAAADGRPGH